MKTRIFAALLFWLAAGTAHAAGNHPELDWRVMDTAHFRVYYYAQVSQTASVIAETAERVYPRLREKYGYDLPLPVRIVLDDTSDPLNGAAYHDYTLFQYEGQASVTEFRAVHDWLSDVVSHEMAHLFSLRKANMFGGMVPGLIASGIDSPSQGRMQVAATFFIPNELTPHWFAEGVAQVDSSDLGHDRWDSLRDMLLRTAMLEGGDLTLGQMGSLTDKNYLQAEKVYNHGFAFLRYLNATGGPGTAQRIAKEAGAKLTWDFREPMAKVLGGDPEATFEAWKAERMAADQAWLQTWSADLYEGDFVVDDGFLTRRAAVSPDGKLLAATSNGGTDFPTGDLFFYDVTADSKENVFSGVGADPAWLPDGSGVIVSSDQAVDLQGNGFNDLYLVTTRGKTHRLTTRMRAQDPAVSPDGKWVAATVGYDGARNVTLWPWNGKKLGAPRRLTRFRPGIEAIHPRFSPDGTQLVFAVNVGGTADLWFADVTTGTLTPLTQTPQEEMEPFFLDATTVAYVSDDRTAFDLYTVNLADRSRTRFTTTVGGAFSPSADATHFYYSVYHDESFAVYRRPRTAEATAPADPLAPIDEACFRADLERMTAPVPPLAQSRAYWFDSLPLKAYPEFVVDDRSARAGATLAWSDVLSKHEFELEALLGQNQDYHLGYKNHQLAPDFILDVSRYLRRNRTVRGVEVAKFDFTFDAALAGMVYVYGQNTAFALTETFKRIDFGFPLDRELERGFEHAGEFTYFDLAPNVDNDVNPTGGREATFRVGLNHTRVFETTGSVLDGKYNKQRFYSWTGGYTEYLALPGDSTLEAAVKGGYLTRPVYPFDQLFLGGRIFFLRQGEFQTDTSFPGYPEFAVAGEKLFLASLAYRFPVWQGHAKAGPFAADSVYLGVFGDAGNVLPYNVPWKAMWKLPEITCPPGERSCTMAQAQLRGLLRDYGAEVRLKTILFDSSAWNSFARVAYGMDNPEKAERLRFYVGLGVGY